MTFTFAPLFPDETPRLDRPVPDRSLAVDWKSGRQALNCRSVVPAHYFLGAFVILDTVVEAVVTTVDALRNQFELLLVGQFVKAVQFPKLTRNPKTHFFGGSYGRVIHQIETEEPTILRVVGASGKLNWPASFVALAIAGLRVAKIFTTFISGAGSNLLHVTKLGRLMGQLRRESALAQVGSNFKFRHRLLDKGQVIGSL